MATQREIDLLRSEIETLRAQATAIAATVDDPALDQVKIELLQEKSGLEAIINAASQAAQG